MDIISESAPKKAAGTQITDVLSKTLSLKTLPPAVAKKMEQDLYFGGKDRYRFEDAGVFLSRTVTLLTYTFDFLNIIASRGDVFEDLLEFDPEDAASRLRVTLDGMRTTAEAVFSEKSMPKEIKASIAMSLGDSDSIYIKDSVRYAGGKDIIQTGAPVSGSSTSNMANYNPLMLKGDPRVFDHDGEKFEALKAEKYDTEIVQSCIRAAKQIHKHVFGTERKAANMFDCEPKLIPLDFDWTVINNIIKSIHPVFNGIDTKLFANLDGAAVKALSRVTSFGIKSVPSPLLATRQFRRMQEGSAEAISLSSLGYNEVAEALDVRVEGAFIFSLNKEYVDYISQGDELTVLSMYRWFKNWSSYYMRMKGSTKTGTRRLSEIPRYVTSAALIPKLKDLREAFGYTVVDTKADESGLVVLPTGTLAAMPSRADIDLEMVKEYERGLNKVLEDLYEHGASLSTEHATLQTKIFAIKADNPLLDAELQAEAQSLAKYKNMVVGTDPDFNMLVTTDAQGLATRAIIMNGMITPNTMANADILGYDFAAPGESPNYRASGHILRDMEDISTTRAYPKAREAILGAAVSAMGRGKLVNEVKDGSIEYISTSAHHAANLISRLCTVYAFCHGQALVPNLQVLIDRAKESMGPELQDNLSASPYDSALYAPFMTNDYKLAVRPMEEQLLGIVLNTLNDAGGYADSNLVATLHREVEGNIGQALEEHSHYYDCGHSPLHQIGNIYNYFGGALLLEACKELANLEKKTLFSSISQNADAPDYATLVFGTLPLATMLAKLVPKAMEIFAEAEVETERTKPDTSISPEDIKFPGLKEGVHLMPHQFQTHQSLRRRPKYAILGIAPGGGKTILGATDIGCLQEELRQAGEAPIKPLVVCPSNLVPNWCTDLHKVADGWNAIPITSDTLNTWGFDEIKRIVDEAPVNTIFVVGLSVLTNAAMAINIGGITVRIRGGAEFINSMGFDYVLLDESHKAKTYKGGNAGSAIHFATKQVFTAPSIRYARIATGTLIMDMVSDVVGQAALLSPIIFGESLESIETENDTKETIIAKAHSRLGNHTAFIDFKRKHWAFMLPNPVDTFIPVDIDDPNVKNSELHLQVYTAMYTELVQLLDVAKRNKKTSTSSVDEDIEGELGDFDDTDAGEDDDLYALIRNNEEVGAHLARMEQMLTDPMGDELCAATFKEAGVTEFTSAKVVAVVDRIRHHFEVAPTRNPEESTHQIFQWSPGVTPREYDVAVWKGAQYMARKKSPGAKRQDLPPSMLPPDKDPDYWKLEQSGKLIVFTRFVRSANAVYEALPANLKRIAVRFHGSLQGESKDNNLDAFKTKDEVQILIANEQAISEGHNMQMGSRIVRVDTPWSPGVYEQSTARIFRPDVSAATLDDGGRPGELRRDLVFIDWIMTRGTLEVGKIARLMWKTLDSVRFNEKGNELYSEVLEKYQLSKISMNAQMLLSNNQIEDYMDYFLAKRDLNEVESEEFANMRASTVAAMVPLTPVAPLPNSSIMEVYPIVANQVIPDIHNWGLERTFDFVKSRGAQLPEDVKDLLHGQPIVTEFGNGVVVSIRTTKKADGKVDEGRPVSSIKVKLADGEVVTVNANKAFIATKVSKKDMARFTAARTLRVTEETKKASSKQARKEEAEAEVKEDNERVRSAKIQKELDAAERSSARAAKRKENAEKKQPANEGVAEAGKRVRKVQEVRKVKGGAVVQRKPKAGAISLDDLETPEKDMTVDIMPTVYNGFVSLYADASDPDSAELKDHDFVKFGSYVYIDCFYYDDLFTIIENLEKKFTFDKPTIKRLEFIQDGFGDTGRMSFNIRQAVKIQSELKQFFLIRHKTSHDRKTLKIYPMVMLDRLRLMIDLRSNPLIRSYVGRKVAGTRKFGTFEMSEGMWISFEQTIPKAKTKINKILKSGINIGNLKAANSALDKLKIKQAAVKKK